MESPPLRRRIPGAFYTPSGTPAPSHFGPRTSFDGSTMPPFSEPEVDYEAVSLADAAGWFFACIRFAVTIFLFVFEPKKLSTTFIPSTRSQLATRFSATAVANMTTYLVWFFSACIRFITGSLTHVRNRRSPSNNEHDEERRFPQYRDDLPPPQMHLTPFGPRHSRLDYLVAQNGAIASARVGPSTAPAGPFTDGLHYQQLLAKQLARAQGERANTLELEWIKLRFRKYYQECTSFDNKAMRALQRKVDLDVKDFRGRGLLDDNLFRTKNIFEDDAHDYVCTDEGYYSSCSCNGHDDSQFRFSTEHQKEEERKRAAQLAAQAKAKAEAEAAQRKLRIERERKAEADRLAQQQGSLQRRKLAKKLIQKPPAPWMGKIQEAAHKHPGTYLSRPAGGDYFIPKSLHRLIDEHGWLDDAAILSYIQLVAQVANQRAGRLGRGIVPKVFALDPLVYTAWVGGFQANKDLSKLPCPLKRKAYLKENRMLLDMETIIVPINSGNHWTLLVISPKARTIEYIDSFGSTSPQAINVAKKYLRDFLGPDYQEKEWAVVKTTSPKQTNGWDCGVFVCTNAECIASGVQISCYEQKDLGDARFRIAAVLLNEGFDGKDLVPAMDML